MSTPDSEIVNAALRRIEADSKHPTRILAAKAVAEFRGSKQSTPWINRHDVHNAPTLDVDAVEQASRPNHAPNMSKVERRKLFMRWLRRRS